METVFTVEKSFSSVQSESLLLQFKITGENRLFFSSLQYPFSCLRIINSSVLFLLFDNQTS